MAAGKLWGGIIGALQYGHNREEMCVLDPIHNFAISVNTVLWHRLKSKGRNCNEALQDRGPCDLNTILEQQGIEFQANVIITAGPFFLSFMAVRSLSACHQSLEGSIIDLGHELHVSQNQRA
jgi:hypothetical protein